LPLSDLLSAQRPENNHPKLRQRLPAPNGARAKRESQGLEARRRLRQETTSGAKWPPAQSAKAKAAEPAPAIEAARKTGKTCR